MRSSSFEDEDRSIIGAFPKAPPARAPMSKGGVKRSPMGILVAVETQMVSTEEYRCHWVKDFPPQRESMNTWCLSCPPLVVSREQERRTVRKLKRWDARWLSAQNREVFISREASRRHSNGCTFDSHVPT
jgi:hypothetical protein